MPTCMNENHFSKYDPTCYMCREELKEKVKQGKFTKDEYNKWIMGEIIIGIPEQTRCLV